MSWQPIETAPRELSVWVYDDGWQGVLSLQQMVMRPGKPWEWRDNSGDSWQEYSPTHWQPLPEPPQTTEAA